MRERERESPVKRELSEKEEQRGGENRKSALFGEASEEKSSE